VPERPVKLVRLEQRMWEAGPENYAAVFDNIAQQYPASFEAMLRNFWGLKESDSLSRATMYDSLYRNTVGNLWMQRLYDSVMLEFKDMRDIESALTEARRYYDHYFPGGTWPEIYTYTGPFVYWTIIDSLTVGIELDMYLGEHFGYYGSYESNMPKYISMRCDKAFIPVNVMQSLVDDVVPTLGSEASLLDEMLRQGKILYFLDCMLPDTHDSLKIGYTGTQVEWCFDNEGEIWKFLAGEELLFSKRMDDLRRYIGEAPNSQGMPEESPGRTAVWSGWQIIRAYMQENPETSLQELFMEMNAMEILKGADYNPGD